jgi:hypothetical protein
MSGFNNSWTGNEGEWEVKYYSGDYNYISFDEESDSYLFVEASESLQSVTCGGNSDYTI